MKNDELMISAYELIVEIVAKLTNLASSLNLSVLSSQTIPEKGG